jgi:hypothetical protein
MVKLDLENDNIFEVDLTLQQARDQMLDALMGDDMEEIEKLTTALDEAQAHVSMGNPVAYLVIKITQ